MASEADEGASLDVPAPSYHTADLLENNAAPTSSESAKSALHDFLSAEPARTDDGRDYGPTAADLRSEDAQRVYSGNGLEIDAAPTDRGDICFRLGLLESGAVYNCIQEVPEAGISSTVITGTDEIIVTGIVDRDVEALSIWGEPIAVQNRFYTVRFAQDKLPATIDIQMRSGGTASVAITP